MIRVSCETMIMVVLSLMMLLRCLVLLDSHDASVGISGSFPFLPCGFFLCSRSLSYTYPLSLLLSGVKRKQRESSFVSLRIVSDLSFEKLREVECLDEGFTRSVALNSALIFESIFLTSDLVTF